MNSLKVIFFGSTSDSVLVLEKLVTCSRQAGSHVTLQIVAVVTQPPRPIGRKQEMTPTPVETWAKEQNIPVLSFQSNSDKPWLFADEKQVIDALEPLKADLLVSASYGQKIPTQSIKAAKLGGLNVHPSLLPRWRGADPVPWAILSGDRQIGVTIVTLEEKFDAGKIIGYKKCSITDTDFADPLRTKLFKIGADLLIDVLPDYLSGKLKGKPQKLGKTPYARRFTREDGFEPWERVQSAIKTGKEAIWIERKFRALSPWPGLWTEVDMTRDLPRRQAGTKHVTRKKRLKILACHLSPVTPHFILDSVQLEGKTPVPFSQFAKSYLPS